MTWITIILHDFLHVSMTVIGGLGVLSTEAETDIAKTMFLHPNKQPPSSTCPKRPVIL
jgi:hypothetical protein